MSRSESSLVPRSLPTRREEPGDEANQRAHGGLLCSSDRRGQQNAVFATLVGLIKQLEAK